MTRKQRPQKIIRLNYYKLMPEFEAAIAVLGDPAEIRLQATKSSFIGVREGVLSLSPGRGGKINIQAMPQNLRYGGLLSAPPFPFSLLPSTGITPIPQTVFNPPLKELVKTIATFAALSSSLVG